MANEKNLKPWKKGQSGNPSGRAKQDAELVRLRQEDQEEVDKTVSKIMRSPAIDLQQMTAERCSTLELIIASVAVKAIKHGDQGRAKFLVERMGGKLPERIEWQGDAPGATINHAMVVALIEEIAKDVGDSPEGKEEG